MILSPEVAVFDSILEGCALVRSDPARYVTEIFQKLDAGRRQNAQEWVTNGGLDADNMVLRYGYVQLPVRAPSVNVVIAEDNETQQYVGGLLVTEQVEGNPEVVVSEEDGVQMRATVRTIVVTYSADWTMYLAHIVFWAILRRRKVLEGWGLLNQRLGMGDLEPPPELQPDTVFIRSVSLTADHFNTVRFDYPQEVTSVTLNPESVGY